MAGLSLSSALSLSLSYRGGGVPALPLGFAFIVDENGDYLLDENDDYLITEFV